MKETLKNEKFEFEDSKEWIRFVFKKNGAEIKSQLLWAILSRIWKPKLLADGTFCLPLYAFTLYANICNLFTSVRKKFQNPKMFLWTRRMQFWQHRPEVFDKTPKTFSLDIREWQKINSFRKNDFLEKYS